MAGATKVSHNMTDVLQLSDEQRALIDGSRYMNMPLDATFPDPTGARRPRRTSRMVAYSMSAALLLPLGMVRGCTPPPPPPAPTVAASAAPECVTITNKERAARGLPALAIHPALELAAVNHSKDQAARNKMSHTGGDGSNPGTRIYRVGYAARTWAENVAYGYNSCPAVMTAWMNSAGHKANILNTSVVQIGVGYAVAGNGTLYWTMVLAG